MRPDEVDSSAEVARWLAEVAGRRSFAVHVAAPAEPATAGVADLSIPRRLCLLALLFLSAGQYVYVSTLLAIASLPALIFFGVR